jgi:GT2 family glycosyltransferase
MKVTVVIPNWNGGELLTALVKQLSRQSYPISDILVVDNGSEDGSAQAAENLGAHVIPMGANRGFAAAVNAGVAQCETPLVAILNNDVELHPEWLRKLVEALGPADVWFATGKVYSAQDREVIDGTFDAICRGGCAWRCGQGRPDGKIWDEPRRIQLAPLTAALMKSELFKIVGQLDERLESYLEDVDFGIRSASKGYSGRYVPQAIAYHVGSGTLGKWNRRTVRQIARNQVLLVAKHYPTVALWRNGWAIAVAQTLWGFVALRHGAGLAYVHGKIEGLLQFHGVRRAGNAAVPRLLRDSESQIRELQELSGFDWYWRLYFALT